MPHARLDCCRIAKGRLLWPRHLVTTFSHQFPLMAKGKKTRCIGRMMSERPEEYCGVCEVWMIPNITLTECLSIVNNLFGNYDGAVFCLFCLELQFAFYNRHKDTSKLKAKHFKKGDGAEMGWDYLPGKPFFYLPSAQSQERTQGRGRFCALLSLLLHGGMWLLPALNWGFLLRATSPPTQLLFRLLSKTCLTFLSTHFDLF